jgi:hypothetical protein
MKTSLSSLLLLCLLGCASPSSKMIVVTYDSDPPGATFRTPSGQIGMLPLDYSYPVTDEFRRGGCIQLDNIQARWRSGATENSEGYTACKKDGEAFTHVFKRPAHPGLSMDKQKADANGKLSMIQVIRGCDEEQFPGSVRCIKNSYSQFGRSPKNAEVKNFYLLIDGVVQDYKINKISLAKAKAEVINAWQSTIDTSNKRVIENANANANASRSVVNSSPQVVQSTPNSPSVRQWTPIVDPSGKSLGRVDTGGGFNSHGTIYNNNGSHSGRIDMGGGFNSHGSVYDKNGNFSGKVVP